MREDHRLVVIVGVQAARNGGEDVLDSFAVDGLVGLTEYVVFAGVVFALDSLDDPVTGVGNQIVLVEGL
jgi:hypothetical protein